MGSGWFNLFRWRLADASLTVLPTAHRGIVKSISFDRDGRQLASIGRQTDSAVYLLDAQTGDVAAALSAARIVRNRRAAFARRALPGLDFGRRERTSLGSAESAAGKEFFIILEPQMNADERG